MPVSKAVLDEIALTQQEYDLIVERLGREPNPVELGMFGALWSEHCGYKHSKPLLRSFPTKGSHVLFGPGEENAGAVDIGDGLAVVFKVESHNHPSAVEPLQGAATGVGGIVRDIFTMGARPIALLNSLRFGPPGDARTRYLFHGVVAGISWYGNCIGVPDVGGEVVFAAPYRHNPLVNALCVGVASRQHLLRARAGGVGNVLMLAGADTGRDGIHGASGLASRTFEEEREMRSTVQVGNPFLEKVLIEACLEAAATPYLEGMQDLGAAGLTSSTVEAAERGGGGVELDLERVPLRETGMNPYEVMLSESQERMLLIVKQGYEEQVRAIFQKWDVPCVTIGRVTGDGMVRLRWHGEVVAELPVRLLTDPPLYRTPSARPAWQDGVQRLGEVPLPAVDAGRVLLRLLASPNIASRQPVFQQYDHSVQTNTVLGPGQADAAVLRLRGTRKGIALATDGNGRLCYLDPYQGGAIAVAEACRNVSCVGAQPVAITDCLNFGNPDRPEVYWQMEEVVRGMADACAALGVPVVSGNVSLYNETRGEAIYPTPIVGALGVLEDVTRHASMAFCAEGHVVALLGADVVHGDAAMLGGSEYLEVLHGRVAGRPAIDLELERRVQALAREAVRQGLVASAHDCADGGLAVAVAESAIAGGLGFRGAFAVTGRWDAALFGEAQSRVVVSLAEEALPALEALARKHGVPLVRLGTVGGDAIALPGAAVPLAEAAQAWRGGLEAATGQ